MLLWLQRMLRSVYAVCFALGRERTGPASEAVVYRAVGSRSEHGRARRWSWFSQTHSNFCVFPSSGRDGVAGEAQGPLWQGAGYR